MLCGDDFRAVETNPARVFLLGIIPDTHESEYGWIEPGARLGMAGERTAQRVGQFWEKPDAGLAETLRSLIARLTVVEEPEFTRRYPAESRSRVEVTTRDGRRLAAETSHPKGHHRNPLTDDEIEAKFRGLASVALGPARSDRVLAEVRGLENAPSLDALYENPVMSS